MSLQIPYLRANAILKKTLSSIRIFVLQVVNNQTPSPRQGVSQLKENINMFIKVTY